MHSILAIETAGEACSVALSVDGDIQRRFELAPRKHNQRLFTLLRDILPDGNLRAAGVDAVAFSNGPGSFTGLRIAAAVVQGLAFAHNLPAVGVSTLAVQVQTALREEKLSQHSSVLSVMDARLGEVYACEVVINDGVAYERSAPVVCAPEALPQHFPDLPAGCNIVGAGLKELSALKKVAAAQAWAFTSDVYANARDMLPLADAALQKGETVAADEVCPRYVRDEVSWKKLPEQGKQGRRP